MTRGTITFSSLPKPTLRKAQGLSQRGNRPMRRGKDPIAPVINGLCAASDLGGDLGGSCALSLHCLPDHFGCRAWSHICDHLDQSIGPRFASVNNFVSQKWDHAITIGGVAATFGRLLLAHINEKHGTIRAFARAIGVGHSTVSQAISGERSPPVGKKLNRWADALGLEDERREVFMESARSQRAKAKTDSTSYVEELEERVALAERFASGVAQFLAEKGVQLPQRLQKMIDALGESS